jgi:hypothetical protein
MHGGVSRGLHGRSRRRSGIHCSWARQHCPCARYGAVGERDRSHTRGPLQGAVRRGQPRPGEGPQGAKGVRVEVDSATRPDHRDKSAPTLCKRKNTRGSRLAASQNRPCLSAQTSTESVARQLKAHHGHASNEPDVAGTRSRRYCYDSITRPPRRRCRVPTIGGIAQAALAGRNSTPDPGDSRAPAGFQVVRAFPPLRPQPAYAGSYPSRSRQ